MKDSSLNKARIGKWILLTSSVMPRSQGLPETTMECILVCKFKMPLFKLKLSSLSNAAVESRESQAQARYGFYHSRGWE